jgi:hypothetical protein
MASFALDHFPANRGWRWKTVSDKNWDGPEGPFQLDAGETQTVHELDVEGEDVIMGWILYGSVTSPSDQIVFESVTEEPGSEGQRRAGGFKAANLLNAGATEARAGFPWVEQTTVDGSDLFTVWVNASGGFAIPVRFPEFSRIQISNPSDSAITVNSFDTASLLVHKPEVFFQQLAAWNALQGRVPPERVTELDSATVDELVSVLTEAPD